MCLGRAGAQAQGPGLGWSRLLGVKGGYNVLGACKAGRGGWAGGGAHRVCVAAGARAGAREAWRRPGLVRGLGGGPRDAVEVGGAGEGAAAKGGLRGRRVCVCVGGGRASVGARVFGQCVCVCVCVSDVCSSLCICVWVGGWLGGWVVGWVGSARLNNAADPAWPAIA